MTLRASDLPKHVREAHGLDSEKPTRSNTGKGFGEAGPCEGRCGCGVSFPTFTAWERHAKKTGHGVWVVDLAPSDPPDRSLSGSRIARGASGRTEGATKPQRAAQTADKETR